ncbi:MAG: TFIIB-type zinc ribbon-containing protein [bacterium]
MNNINNDVEEIVTYKCKNCGSDLTFNPTSGKLACDSCQSEFFVSEFEKPTVEEFEKIEEKTTTTTYSESEVSEFNCNNCGAVLVTDSHTASTNCNFCGSPMVINARLSGSIAPAKVIPFKFNQKDAQEALKKWCRNGRVTPNDFLTESRLRNLEGLYVPFWLYDINTNAEGEARCTRVRSYVSGQYQITETRHYIAYRRVTADYKRIPADSSEKMDDKVMDMLEPFNYKDLENFNSAYLSGYCSEKYNYSDKELFPRIEKRTNEFIRNYMRSTIHGYSTVHLSAIRSHNQQRDAIYTLFPVYTINYKYKDKVYNFSMNGQTGKIVGKPPVCTTKVVKYALLSFFSIAIIGEAIYWIARLFL